MNTQCLLRPTGSDSCPRGLPLHEPQLCIFTKRQMYSYSFKEKELVKKIKKKMSQPDYDYIKGLEEVTKSTRY